MPRRREPKRESCLSSLCRALAGFSSPCQPPAPRFQISRRRYIFLRMQLVASRFPVPRLLPLYWARANLSTDCAFSYFFIRRKSYFMRKKDWRDSQEKAKKKRRKKKAQSLVYFLNETRGLYGDCCEDIWDKYRDVFFLGGREEKGPAVEGMCWGGEKQKGGRTSRRAASLVSTAGRRTSTGAETGSRIRKKQSLLLLGSSFLREMNFFFYFVALTLEKFRDVTACIY
jgi:hypothetical protein